MLTFAACGGAEEGGKADADASQAVPAEPAPDCVIFDGGEELGPVPMPASAVGGLLGVATIWTPASCSLFDGLINSACSFYVPLKRSIEHAQLIEIIYGNLHHVEKSISELLTACATRPRETWPFHMSAAGCRAHGGGVLHLAGILLAAEAQPVPSGAPGSGPHCAASHATAG